MTTACTPVGGIHGGAVGGEAARSMREQATWVRPVKSSRNALTSRCFEKCGPVWAHYPPPLVVAWPVPPHATNHRRQDIRRQDIR